VISLGVDPSLRSYGWAVLDNGAPPSSRLIASGHEGTLKSSVPVARFMHFRALVKKLLSQFSIDVVGIESPAYDAGPFQTVHFGLMLYSLEAIFEARKDCVLYDPTTLKYLIERSSSTKTDMQRYVQIDTLSTQVINNDEADAYCLAKEAARFVDLKNGKLKPEDLTISEKRVFLERTKKVKTLSGKVTKRMAHIFRENSRYFEFSKIPSGSIDLPEKSEIDTGLLEWLELNS
jgi:Holliday junction resolvasome RuvABC endonuclease subunit